MILKIRDMGQMWANGSPLLYGASCPWAWTMLAHEPLSMLCVLQYDFWYSVNKSILRDSL